MEADLKRALIRGRGASSNRGAYQNLKSYGCAKLSRSAKPRKYGICPFCQRSKPSSLISLTLVINAIPFFFRMLRSRQKIQKLRNLDQQRVVFPCIFQLSAMLCL